MVLQYIDKHINDISISPNKETIYKHIKVDIGGFVHWFPKNDIQGINANLVYVNMPQFDWVVNVVPYEHTIVINTQQTYNLSENDIEEYSYLIDYIEKYSICSYNVEPITDFSDSVISRYVYGTINKMLTVFSPDNIKNCTDKLLDRILYNYVEHKNTHKFNELYNVFMHFKHNRDVSLIYVMHNYINNLGYLEMLFALYYFNVYKLYTPEKEITIEDINQYLSDSQVHYTEEICKFKKYLNAVLTQYIDDVIYRINTDVFEKRKSLDLYISSTTDSSIIFKYNISKIYRKIFNEPFNGLYRYKIEQNISNIINRCYLENVFYDYSTIVDMLNESGCLIK